LCSSKSVMVVTRNEWGGKSVKRLAPLSRRFIMWQMSMPVIGCSVSVLVLPAAVRKGTVGKAGGLDVGEQYLLEIMPDRDLARLAALLGKAERVPGRVVLKILEVQLGDSSDVDGGVDEDGEDRLVA
jgi:hypothetical protein